jgi:hypothetical protein
MRRSVVFILIVALCLGLTQSGALASKLAADKGKSAAKRHGTHPVRVPAVSPKPTAGHPGAYGYRSAARLSELVGGGNPAPAAPASGGGSATVTVTAVVLPVRTIIVKDGAVAEVWSNTPDPNGHNSLYMVREGSLEGSPGTLSAGLWRQARACLARAYADTGRICTA